MLKSCPKVVQKLSTISSHLEKLKERHWCNRRKSAMQWCNGKLEEEGRKREKGKNQKKSKKSKKFSKNCQKVIKKLVKKLLISCQKVVNFFSKSCQKTCQIYQKVVTNCVAPGKNNNKKAPRKK
jgi:hypothetical protein